MKKILIIDDEPDIRELLEITLGRMNIETHSAANKSEAITFIDNNHYDMCFTDMNLPDGTGLEIIEYVNGTGPDTPIAMITAYGNTDLAVKALKAGAFDFLSKPVDLEHLRNLIANALNLSEKNAISDKNQTPLLGETPLIQSLKQKIAKLARSQAPVFITGESGSGKEIAARLIHNMGSRSNAAFVAVNCGAIPNELMESEFFGHIKGSFTGAFEDKKGLFETAKGGTLFLDEVADLPLSMQVKLLRALQEKTIRPIGATKEIPTDIRLLSATHKDLTGLVENGGFRQDLFYRINVIELQIPTLRERKEDISLLSHSILKKIANEWQVDSPSLSGGAKQALLDYAFPGNVRELENILHRAFTLCENNTIEESDLNLKNNSEEIFKSGNKNTDPESAFGSLDNYLESIEKEVICLALEKTRWNKTAAAELLGISFRQMRYRCEKLKID